MHCVVILAGIGSHRFELSKAHSAHCAARQARLDIVWPLWCRVAVQSIGQQVGSRSLPKYACQCSFMKH